MPRKPSSPRKPPGKPPEEPASELPGGDDSEGSALLYGPDEIDPRWRDPVVRIYREDDRTKKPVFHGVLAVDEASEMLVAEMFGGGRWKAQIIATDELGQSNIKRSKVFSLSGPYHPPVKALPMGQRPEAAAAAAPMRGEVSTLPTANESLNAALVGSVIDLLKAQREGVGRNPIADWVPVLVPLASGLMALLSKMAEKKSEAPTEMVIALEQLRAELASMKDRPGPATTAVTDALEGIERIVKLTRNVKRMAGADDEAVPPDPETAMWGMAGKLLEHLGPKGIPAPTSEQPAAVIGTIPPAPTPTAARPLWEQVLLNYRARLVDSAMRGVNPELVADVAVQFAPPQFVGTLQEFVQRPDMVAVASQVVPELQQFPQWTEQFFQALRGAVTGEEEGDDGPGQGEG